MCSTTLNLTQLETTRVKIYVHGVQRSPCLPNWPGENPSEFSWGDSDDSLHSPKHPIKSAAQTLESPGGLVKTDAESTPEILIL